MDSMVKSVEVIEHVDPDTLPLGEYEGTWGGYIAEVTIEGILYRFHTVNGIRTIDAPCIVSVKEDGVTVRLKEGNHS